MNMRNILKDIILIISWRQFSRQYFGKSASWIYHKIDGIDELTEAERLKFRESLLSLSEIIRDTASRLWFLNDYPQNQAVVFSRREPAFRPVLAATAGINSSLGKTLDITRLWKHCKRRVWIPAPSGGSEIHTGFPFTFYNTLIYIKLTWVRRIVSTWKFGD